MKKIVSLTLFLGSLSVLAQPVPMKDQFYIESDLKFQEDTIKRNQEYLKNFSQKFSEAAKVYDSKQLVLGKLEVKVSELKQKKKLKKQEKSFLVVAGCIKDRFANRPGTSIVSASTVSQCPYSRNIDPRLFKREDELSKLFMELQDAEPSEKEHAEIKKYLQALDYKKTLESSSESNQKKLKELQLLVKQRHSLDEKIEKLSTCKKEVTLEYPVSKAEFYDRGEGEVIRDLLAGITGEKSLDDSVGTTYISKDLCKFFDHLKTYGFCSAIKLETDCVNCAAKKTKSISDFEKITAEKHDCVDKKSNSKMLWGLVCNKSEANNIIWEKDKEKALLKLRKLIATNLAQGLPVGVKKESKYSSVLGLRNNAGVCEYLVRKYPEAKESWTPESSLIKELEEVSFIKRQFN